MPYRSETPLRVYPLRTNRTSLVIAIVLATISALTTAWLVGPMLAYGRAHGGFSFLLIMVGLWGTAAAYGYGARHDSVSGTRGELRLFPNRVEVPRSFGGPPLVIPVEQLSTHIKRFEGRLWWVVTVSVVEVLHLHADGIHRGLSSRLFERPETLRELAVDLAALKAGQPLPTHARDDEHGISAPRERDEYDDKLDAELEALD